MSAPAAYKIQEACAYLQQFASNIPLPKIAVVLGSGQSDASFILEEGRSTPYQHIPHFPVSKVHGHDNACHIGFCGNTPLWILGGRSHLYEGFGLDEVTFATRVLAAMGVRIWLQINASGGICPEYRVGDIVLVADHINLSGQNPLVGCFSSDLPSPFIDMQHVYTPSLRSLFKDCAKELQWHPLQEGTYAWVSGPSYETPAEIRMLKALGADLVGMSTIPEVVIAKQLGMQNCVLSVVTNQASGLTTEILHHEDVAIRGKQAIDRLSLLLQSAIPKCAQMDTI
jgi:purine-nucleoside phosphorylase